MAGQKPILLAVDDEIDMLETYRAILSKKFTLLTAISGHEALETIKTKPVAIILLDLKMPKMGGIEVLRTVKSREPEIDIIVITALKEINSAVEAMKAGASDYITKPFDVKELNAIISKILDKRALVKENLYLKETLKESRLYCDLVGQSPAMKQLYRSIDQVSPTNSTILINGESGTGKELVARAIHVKSKRAHKPFVALNCAAIPENLIESELFGHERGSFTGALDRKLGKFEIADGGTLFLDEIGCMPVPMQAKLLRVLEDRKIERLGGEKEIPVDVRIISATNIDFKKAIDEGKFRADLYYRLNVIPLNLSPLRERKADMPLLLNFFVNKFNKLLNKSVKGFSNGAMQSLLGYDWPGNVRELQNLVERMVVLSSGEIVDEDALPFTRKNSDPVVKVEVVAANLTGNLKELVANYEKQLIVKALEENDQNRSETAKSLDIPRSTLNSRIEVLGIM